jgi:hypothetical protein
MVAEQSTNTCDKQKTLYKTVNSGVIQNTWTVNDIQILIKRQIHKNDFGNVKVTSQLVK